MEMQSGEGAGTGTAVRTTGDSGAAGGGASGAATGGLVGGMGQAAVIAATALAGCVLLIVLGATMSMCWAVHPLLTVAAAVLVVWVGRRLAGHAFCSGGRSQ
jgi:hypothetical protein